MSSTLALGRDAELSDESVVEGRLAPVSRLQGDIEDALVATGKKRCSEVETQAVLVIPERIPDGTF